MKKEISTIVIHEKYEEGLYKIDNIEYLQVLFYIHRAEEIKELIGPTYTGEIKGVFASRSQNRPSPIGLTTIKLLGRKGRELTVEGLDAINGTPIIDIKPFVLTMDSNEKEKIKKRGNVKYPRMKILKLIRSNDLNSLLHMAAGLHGHYCGGLAFGVISGAYMMNYMSWNPEGMENNLVIAETNNCAADGIQFVTGCTLGNNSLIYRDYGKTAFAFVNRKGEGIRVSLKIDYKEKLPKDEEFDTLFEKVIKRREGTEEDMEKFKNSARKNAFKLIDVKVEDIFNIEKDYKAEIPQYAPIHDNFICSSCQESTMTSRLIEKNGNKLCIPCAQSEFMELSGFGIQMIKHKNKPSGKYM